MSTREYPPLDGIFVSREDVLRFLKSRNTVAQIEKCILQSEGPCAVGSQDKMVDIHKGLAKRGYNSSVDTFDGRLYQVTIKGSAVNSS